MEPKLTFHLPMLTQIVITANKLIHLQKKALFGERGYQIAVGAKFSDLS